MWIKVFGLRSGQALIWVLDRDILTLHRVERWGARFFSRVVLWGDPAKWPVASQESARAFLAEVQSTSAQEAHVSLEGLIEALRDGVPQGSETPAAYLKEPPVFRGKFLGGTWDVDLTVHEPRK